MLCWYWECLLERNASLGQKIDLAIKINAPQRPIPLEQIYHSFQLRLPASIQHAHLLFRNKLEELDVSLLQAQRNWCGIEKCLQEQWLNWLRIGGFMHPAREDVNEMIYYTNPFHRNISKKLCYYTTNHPFYNLTLNICTTKKMSHQRFFPNINFLMIF